MSFLSGDELESICQKSLGVSFNKENIKQAAYELSLGDEAFRTDSENRKVEILDKKNNTIEINPGQFALLMTNETIKIPLSVLAFISIKASEKLKGLINVSGFHLDPGFDGRILFSVYNAGPSTITLRKDEKYFLVWFSSLTTPLPSDKGYNKNSNHYGMDHIPTKYMDALKVGKLASPNALFSKIDDLEHVVDIKSRHANYFATAIITLLIGIAGKYALDWNSHKEGYEERIKEEALIQEIRSIPGYPVDKFFLQKIDSILDVKIARLHITNDSIK